MNEPGWTRDKTPYLVFSCKNCHQFSYVKITQKTKKCLRCGRTHQINSILPIGELVYGISNALELVKKRQGELKGAPHFKVDASFKIITELEAYELDEQEVQDQKQGEKIGFPFKGNEDSLLLRFKEMLLELASMYKSFPKYLIEMMAENYSIPNHKVSRLLKKMVQQGFLHYSKKLDHYFLLNSRNAF